MGAFLVLEADHVELQDVGLATEQRAYGRHGAAEIAVDKLLDVGARLRLQVELDEVRREADRRCLVDHPFAHHQRAAMGDAQRGALLQAQVGDGVEPCEP